MAGHSGGGIIQHTENHIGFVVNGIDNACHSGGKERGVSNKCKLNCIWIRPVESLRHRNAGSHAKTSVYHIQRHCIAQGIATDISTKIAFSRSKCTLYGIEGGTMRTSCAKNRRTNWKCRQIGTIHSGLLRRIS